MQCVVVPVHRFRFLEITFWKKLLLGRFIIGVHLPTSLPLLFIYFYILALHTTPG